MLLILHSPEHCISISTFDTIKPKKAYFILFFINKGQFESYKLNLEYATDTFSFLSLNFKLSNRN